MAASPTRMLGDRAGIHCKTVKDAALVLDAMKGFKSDDIFTAIPKGIIPKEPYASFLVPDSAVKDKPLKGVRVGIVREFMVKAHEERRSDQRSDRQGNQDRAARQAGCDARGVGGSDCIRTTRRCPT